MNLPDDPLSTLTEKYRKIQAGGINPCLSSLKFNLAIEKIDELLQAIETAMQQRTA